MTYFEPSEGNRYQNNMEAFIKYCKDDLTIFGADLPFSENVWDISKSIEVKATSGRSSLNFSTLTFAKSFKGVATHDNIIAMQEPFLSFAKAYFRYRYANNPTKSYSSIISSLRIIEQALREMTNSVNPIDINNDVLNKAIEITKANYTQAVGYRFGQLIEAIGKFLTEKKIVKVSIDWPSPIKRPSDSTRVGKKADDRRNSKMPSLSALEALPEIFIKAQTPYELMASSIVALLLCAPNRINEIFLLPYDIEVLQKDKDGKEVYGLRWFPAKGAEPMVKWIIPSMVEIAKEAIRRIKQLTKPAREIAKWYDKHPNKLYLPNELEYLRNKHLVNTKEISYILYGKDTTDNNIDNKRSTIHVWLKNNFILCTEQKGLKYALFSDIEKSILKQLPKRFPYLNSEIGLKYSAALILQRQNEFNRQKGVLNPTIAPVNQAFISDALGGRNKELSLFSAFGFKERDGKAISVTTHQFRHYLNTLAQKGGASQLDIAKWSGRADIHQNKDYDHLNADDMLMMLRDSVGDKNLMVGPLAHIEDLDKKVVISRDEFARLKIRTAHVTEFGVCIHDYTMTPCQLHRDCMNCVEQVCMKGDKEREYRIKQAREQTKTLLDRAILEQQDNHFGANRWVEHHNIALERLNQLCDLLDNPEIPDGSFIQLSNIPVTSPIGQASQMRQDRNKQIMNHTDPVKEFDEMKKLLFEIGDTNESNF